MTLPRDEAEMALRLWEHLSNVAPGLLHPWDDRYASQHYPDVGHEIVTCCNDWSKRKYAAGHYPVEDRKDRGTREDYERDMHAASRDSEGA
jgi:hypothetical protein